MTNSRSPSSEADSSCVFRCKQHLYYMLCLSFRTNQLDENLREASFVYNSFREKGSIGPIKVHLVKSGTFRNLREHLLTNTQASINQVKIPRVLKVDQSAEVLMAGII